MDQWTCHGCGGNNMAQQRKDQDDRCFNCGVYRPDQPVGFEACWHFDPQEGRCRKPKEHTGECAHFWCKDDGPTPPRRNDEGS